MLLVLTYSFLSSLPSHQKIVHEINSIFYDFPWDSKGDKNKRTEIINDYDKSGLKMIDIKSFKASLKMKWVQSYLYTENKGKWKFFFFFLLGEIRQEIGVLVQFKTKRCITAENKRPFFQRNCRILVQLKL